MSGLFTTRSRSSSTVSPPTSQHSQQHQQQGTLPLPSWGSSSQLLQQQDGGNGSIDQQGQQQQGHPTARPNASAVPAVAAAARPQLFSDFFRRYELMIEFTNLRNPHHCPSGLYVMPAADNMNRYYRDAVFKFQLLIPPDYPDRRPTVQFLSDMFHPLIDNHGQMALQYQFPQWRPHKDYLFHVLHFVKAAFKKCVLDSIVEKQAVNKEAYRMYRQENKIFAKLAQQRAQLSITDSNLYDNYPANNSIKFSRINEEEFGEIKHKMMASGLSAGALPMAFSGDKRGASLESLASR
ncbi:hypothetical protein BGX21_007417 [Mortierella sp. AD011]|nr:hypothetical protein BGX20_003049 [Mortierella sp. AD010]KAF9398696.1 hypothetical protein BGX21_007417 [Mortierella sp. AD011]